MLALRETMFRIAIFASLVLVVTGCSRPVAIQQAAGLSKSQSAAIDSLDSQIAFWEKRLPRDPEDDTPAQKLAAAYLAKAKKTGDFSLYIKAEQLLDGKHNPEVKPDFTTATLLASAKAAQHKFTEAAALAELAIVAAPNKALPYAILFDARLELGDLKSAAASLNKLKELEPGFEALTREANYRFVVGDTDGGITSLKNALIQAEARELAPDDRSWCHVRLGATYYDNGNFELAEEHYAKALELSPNGYLPLEHLAELRADQGKYAESLELYNRVIEISPNPEFFEAIGSLYETMNDPLAANAWFAKAEEAALQQLRNGDIGIYRYLAKFYSDVKPNPAEALRYAQADLKIRQDIHTYDTLAWALHQSGLFADAAVAMDKALSTGVRDASIFCHAAAVYGAVNNNNLASQFRKSTLEINPHYAGEPCLSSSHFLRELVFRS